MLFLIVEIATGDLEAIVLAISNAFYKHSSGESVTYDTYPN